MRRLLILLLLAPLTAPFAAAQYDANAPEPFAPLGGGLALVSEGCGEKELRFVFESLGLEGNVTGRVLSRSAEPGGLAATLGLPVLRLQENPYDLEARTDRPPRLLWIADSEPVRFNTELMMYGWKHWIPEYLEGGGVVIAEGRSAAILGRTMPHRLGADTRNRMVGLCLLDQLRVVLDPQASPLLVDQRPWGILTLGNRAACVARGRQMQAMGPATLTLPACHARPASTLSLERTVDLVAVHRALWHRASGGWPGPDPPLPNVESGSLVIVGGGGLPSSIGRRFLELAGGPDAPVVYVPCTEAGEVTDEPRMVETLRSWGFTDVTWIHTKDRQAADTDEALLGPLRRARAVWFGGGRQWNLVDSWQHTEAHRLMHEVLAKGGVIGGSSAGASIQCDYLCRGNPLGNREVMSEGYEAGLGFLTGCGVDQHFAERKRQPDLVSLARTYPQLLGIGIDEATALVVSGARGEVLGRGEVWFYDGRTAQEGVTTPVRLGAGGAYDLAARAALP